MHLYKFEVQIFHSRSGFSFLFDGLNAFLYVGYDELPDEELMLEHQDLVSKTQTQVEKQKPARKKKTQMQVEKQKPPGKKRFISKYLSKKPCTLF